MKNPHADLPLYAAAESSSGRSKFVPATGAAGKLKAMLDSSKDLDASTLIEALSEQSIAADAELAFQVGRFYFRQKRFAEADKPLRLSLLGKPTDNYSTVLLSESCLRQTRFHEAMSTALTGLGNGQFTLDLARSGATAALRANLAHFAQSFALLGLAVASDDGGLHRIMMEASLLLGDATAGKKHTVALSQTAVQTLWDRPIAGLDIFVEMAEQMSDWGWPRACAARALLESGRVQDAHDLLSPCLNQNIESTSHPYLLGLYADIARRLSGQEAEIRIKSAINLMVGDDCKFYRLLFTGYLLWLAGDLISSIGMFKQASGYSNLNSFSWLNGCVTAALPKHPEIVGERKYIEARTHINNEGDLPKPHVPMVLAACDAKYFSTYARGFISRIAKRASSFQIHIHVVNPTAETRDLIDSFRNLWPNSMVSFSSQDIDLAELRSYYACARFFVARHLLAAVGAPIIVSDIDAVANSNLLEITAACVQADAGLRFRSGRREYPWDFVTAALCVFNPTRGAQLLLEYVADFVGHFTYAAPLEDKWWIDQNALLAATHWFGNKQEVSVIDILSATQGSFELNAPFADKAKWFNSKTAE